MDTPVVKIVMSPARLDPRDGVTRRGSTGFSLRGLALPLGVRPMADHGPEADVRRSLPGHQAVLPRSTATGYRGRC